MSVQIYEQKDFTGGLNLRSDQFQLADNESPEMLNVEVDPRGGVFSRGGMKRINSVDVAGTWSPQKLTPFYGASNRLMLANATKVYYWNTTVFTAVQYSGVDIVADAAHGACLAPWGNYLYIATGCGPTATNSYRWDGTTTVQMGLITSSGDWAPTYNGNDKMPRAEHFVVHANKMFAADVVVEGVRHKNRVYWSNEDLPQSWSKNDYVEIAAGGNGITGILAVNGMLLIFKPYAIYALFGYETADFRLVEISTNIGCADHHAVVATEGGAYFYATHKGLYYFDGSNLVDLFEPLRPAFDLGYINSGSLESVSVSWVGKRVWLSLPYDETGAAVSTPTINLVYDPSMRSYTMFSTKDGKGVVGGCDFRDSAGNEYNMMCHPTVPCVLSVDNYDTPWDEIDVDGTKDGFPTVYRTKWFDGGSYMQRKMFRRPDLVMRETETNQTITVKVFHDFQEAAGSEARSFNIVQGSTLNGMVWGNDNWAYEPVGQDPYGSVWSPDALGGTIKTIKNLGLCKSVQLRFTGELSKPWGINSIGYKWMPRRVRG